MYQLCTGADKCTFELAHNVQIFVTIAHRHADKKVTLWNILSKLVKTLALPGLPGGPGGPLSPGGPLTPVPMQLKHVSPRSPKKICIEKLTRASGFRKY